MDVQRTEAGSVPWVKVVKVVGQLMLDAGCWSRHSTRSSQRIPTINICTGPSGSEDDNVDDDVVAAFHSNSHSQ
ncbi:GL12911 [Drosophila persimilis]|uniref:GL12911 n=1 Tax=Drosophila persimilis TaxID=7234 RepID=B4GV33_DROPE|nr:GL12911 [Drosophila persimilis]